MTLACLAMAGALTACNIGSYDDAVAQFNQNAPPAPPSGGEPPPPDGEPPPPGGEPPPGAGFAANFSAIQASVFTPSCATAGCHSDADARAGLSLTAQSSYAMLVGIASSQQAGLQRVNPGRPDISYLIQKLEGMAGITGGQMPPGAALPQVDIDVIRQWITDGAGDDRAQSANAIQVASLFPAPGAMLEATPMQLIVGFDRDVDASTVNPQTFLLEASGGDMTFGDGNETAILAESITVPAASPRSAVFDLTGRVLPADIYRVRLLGSGASMILDLDANALIGNVERDASSAGISTNAAFEAYFRIVEPVVAGPLQD